MRVEYTYDKKLIELNETANGNDIEFLLRYLIVS